MSKNPNSNNWAMSIVALLVGIPVFLIYFTVAGYNAWGAPKDLFDYYAHFAPVVFVVLLVISYWRRSDLYAFLAILIAIAPLAIFFIAAFLR